MRADIKEKIGKINRGEVPEGYKKTFLGILPTAWTIKKMKEICLRNFVGIATSTTQHVRDSGVPLIRNQNITENKLDTSDMLYITEEFNKMNENKKIEEFDVLSVRTGFAGISCVVPKAYKGAQTFTTLVSRPNRKKVNAFYLTYYINSSIGSTIINKLLFGNAQKNLNVAMMEIVDIILPTLPEQQKIASILSTWDKAIELREKLIQQKKEQKKGLMQNLLTGKVRLKDFDEEWKYLKAGDIFVNVTDKSHGGIGTVLSSTQDKGIIPRDLVGIDIKFDKENLSSYKKVNKGEFVISLRSFQGGIEYSEYEGLLSPAYTILKNKVDISNSFYKHLFKSNDFITRLNGLIYGIRDGKQIGFKDFSVLKLPYPRMEEQNEIAKILDHASKEIELHEKKLERLQEQKKGLMQLLLTGKVRVEC